MNLHAELTKQTFWYVARLCAAEDYASALELGLRPDQLETIRHLPMEALNELESCLSGHVLHVAIDPEALDTALNILQRHLRERALVREMVQAGATYAALSDLFGIESHCYAGYRKLLQLSDQGIGRWPLPNQAMQARIWNAWCTCQETDPRQRFLAVHRSTGEKLGVIWRLIRAWEQHGDWPVGAPDLEEEES